MRAQDSSSNRRRHAPLLRRTRSDQANSRQQPPAEVVASFLPNTSFPQTSSATPVAASLPATTLPPLTGDNCPTLDLHGLRKDAALRAVTDFLELHRTSKGGSRPQYTTSGTSSSRTMVCLITGTGSHSTDGPVLRSAIGSLLSRRQMYFVRNTPGSFLVDAASGERWAVGQKSAVDTKVVVVPASDEDSESLRLQRVQSLPVHRRTGYFSRPSQQASTTAAETTEADSRSMSSLSAGPSVREVAQEDAALAQACKESQQLLQEERQRQRQRVAEQQALEEALATSRRLQQTEEEEFSARLQETLKRSEVATERSSTSMADDDDEATLHRVLQESQRDDKRRDDDTLTAEELDRLTQQALELSLQQEKDDAVEEERLLQQVLQQSMYESTWS